MKEAKGLHEEIVRRRDGWQDGWTPVHWWWMGVAWTAVAVSGYFAFF